MSLYVDNKEKFLRVIDAWSEKEVKASEKLLARHIGDVLDWHSEVAEKDSDFWGNRVRVSPQTLVSQTGMNRKTIWRILTRWNDATLISKKSEHYMEADGEYHSRMYIELSDRFYNGDIRIGRVPKKSGVRKGHKFATCPNCGYRIRKGELHYQEEDTTE